MPNMCKGETRLLSLIASVTQAGADAQEKWVNREKKDPQNAIFQYLGNFANVRILKNLLYICINNFCQLAIVVSPSLRNIF